MLKKNFCIFLFLILIALVKVQASSDDKTIIYRTRGNYNQLVPIRMANEKTVIATIPIIEEIKAMKEEIEPIVLNNGFLLDRANININSAFINMTYEDYADLKQVPELSEFFKLIIDDEPFVDFYECEQRFTTDEINKMIDNKELDMNCQQLVIKKPMVIEKNQTKIPFGWILVMLGGLSLIVWERKKNK